MARDRDLTVLSPSATDAGALVAQAFNETLRLDTSARAAGDLSIGILPDDPEWLATLRGRIALLSAADAAWTADEPEIKGALVLQFSDYASAFAAVTAMTRDQSPTAEEWTQLLGTALVPRLQAAAARSESATRKLRGHRDTFHAVQPLLRRCIDRGWQECPEEEAQMRAIATHLALLQDTLDALEQPISAAEIRSVRSIVSTMVKTLYNIATEVGESFSLISLATSAFTVGNRYDDLVADTAGIRGVLERIGELQLQASYAAQAAAGATLVLRLVSSVQLTIEKLLDLAVMTTALWRTELDKVQAVISELAGGADPATCLELFTVPAANRAWHAIGRCARAACAVTTIVGTPVVIDPQDPVTPGTELTAVAMSGRA